MNLRCQIEDLFIIFLGWKSINISQGFSFHRKKYMFDILKKFKMNACKFVATPLAQSEKVSKDDGERLYDATQF